MELEKKDFRTARETQTILLCSAERMWDILNCLYDYEKKRNLQLSQAKREKSEEFELLMDSLTDEIYLIELIARLRNGPEDRGIRTMLREEYYEAEKYFEEKGRQYAGIPPKGEQYCD